MVGQATRDEAGENEGHLKGEQERLAQMERDKAEIHEKNPALFRQALELAKDADAVIFVGGLNHDYDSEGFDRPDMKLPYEQDLLIEELLKVRKDAVITFVGGSPVEMPWRNQAQAILWTYYAGMETGNAFAKMIFGEVNPSGKLAETFPDKYEAWGTGSAACGIRLHWRKVCTAATVILTGSTLLLRSASDMVCLIRILNTAVLL